MTICCHLLSYHMIIFLWFVASHGCQIPALNLGWKPDKDQQPCLPWLCRTAEVKGLRMALPCLWREGRCFLPAVLGILSCLLTCLVVNWAGINRYLEKACFLHPNSIQSWYLDLNFPSSDSVSLTLGHHSQFSPLWEQGTLTQAAEQTDT